LARFKSRNLAQGSGAGRELGLVSEPRRAIVFFSDLRFVANRFVFVRVVRGPEVGKRRRGEVSASAASHEVITKIQKNL
jgi:hypothetical protein